MADSVWAMAWAEVALGELTGYDQRSYEIQKLSPDGPAKTLRDGSFLHFPLRHRENHLNKCLIGNFSLDAVQDQERETGGNTNTLVSI